MRKLITLLGAAVTTIFVGSEVNAPVEDSDNLFVTGINVVEVEMEGKTFNFLYDEHKHRSVLDSESVIIKEINTYTGEFQKDTFTVIESEYFEVKDYSTTIDNIANLTGEKIDGVLNAQTLDKIDQTKIKIKNYKQKE
jgi:hypothetical protein